jgi:hypothetical protein
MLLIKMLRNRCLLERFPLSPLNQEQVLGMGFFIPREPLDTR